MSSVPSRYNNVQVALHWLVALLVLFMLFMGNFVLALTPNADPMKIAGLRAHMIVGSTVLVLIFIRLFWRWMSAQPPHAETGNALLDRLGVAAHYALNILALLVAASGIGIALQAGLPDIVLGGQGTLPEHFFGYPSRIAHGILTKILLAVIVLHILGALYHQFFLKDQLFKRVWFGKSDD